MIEGYHTSTRCQFRTPCVDLALDVAVADASTAVAVVGVAPPGPPPLVALKPKWPRIVNDNTSYVSVFEKYCYACYQPNGGARNAVRHTHRHTRKHTNAHN